jgi:hypothetical protein
MADEPNTSPGIPNFTSNITEALKVHSEIQTKIAEAMKAWLEQYSSLSADLKPIEEALRTLTTARSKQWARHAEAVQKVTQDVAGKWAEIGAALAKKLAEYGPRLQRTLERTDHVGQLGWTVTMRMTPRDVVRLSVMKLPAEADGYMLAWYEAVDLDLEYLEQRILDVRALEAFRTPLSQCFTAYRRGDFAISIPFLVAVLERGIRNLAPAQHFFTTNVERMVKDLCDRMKKDEPDTVEAQFWISLYTFVQWLYEQYGPTKSGEDRIFRHGIQHGTQPPPNEKVEALRLLHALDTVAALYKRSEAASPTV